MSARAILFAAAALSASGCSFTKDPFLFTSLADGSLTVAPDAIADAGVIDGAIGDGATADARTDAGRDSGLDAGALDSGPADTGFAAGRALELSGVDQGLVGTGAGLLPHGGAPRTVEAWIKGASAPRSARILGYGAPGRQFDVVIVVSGGQGRLMVLDGRDVAIGRDTPLLADSNWHHVAVVMTATSGPMSRAGVGFYVDGVLTSTTTKGPNDVIRAEANRLVIGGAPGDAIGFTTAQIDEVRLWSVVRRESQIRDSRTRVITSSNDLVGYWSMNVMSMGGPGVVVPNEAMSRTAPSLISNGDVRFVPSTAY